MKKIFSLQNQGASKPTFRSRFIVTGLAVVVVALVAAGVYATTSHKTKPKIAVRHNSINRTVLAASSTPTPTATPSPTSTPTPVSKSSPATTKTVVSSVPKIPLVPMGTPTPTGPTSSASPSPIVVTPELSSWYETWAKNAFTGIWENFGYMEYYANESNITEIEDVCWQFGEIGQQGLNVPTAPDATVDAAWRSDMSQLEEGSAQCQDGINNNDADTATNGLDLLGDAGTSLRQLQGELSPTDAAQIDTIIANSAISG